MTYKPTDEEVDALASELAFVPTGDALAEARWVLSRFVRREEHEREYSPVELADAMLIHLREKETK